VYLPFGKHKGQHVGAVPSSYLFWLLENTDLKPHVEYGVREELARRFSPPVRRELGTLTRAELEARVSDWFRCLAVRFHPDRGGHDRDMVVVNEAHEQLRAVLGLRH
jgi:hypothetical protein